MKLTETSKQERNERRKRRSFLFILSFTFSPPKRTPAFKSILQCRSSKPRSSIKMSSSHNTPTTHGVEHIVLFRVKDDAEPSKINTMLNENRSLVTLDQVRHLTVVPILRTDASSSPDLHFTHLLHSRYDSKEDLEAYNAHPRHLAAVRGSIFSMGFAIASVARMSQVR